MGLPSHVNKRVAMSHLLPVITLRFTRGATTTREADRFLILLLGQRALTEAPGPPGAPVGLCRFEDEPGIKVSCRDAKCLLSVPLYNLS